MYGKSFGTKVFFTPRWDFQEVRNNNTKFSLLINMLLDFYRFILSTKPINLQLMKLTEITIQSFQWLLPHFYYFNSFFFMLFKMLH